MLQHRKYTCRWVQNWDHHTSLTITMFYKELMYMYMQGRCLCPKCITSLIKRVHEQLLFFQRNSYRKAVTEKKSVSFKLHCTYCTLYDVTWQRYTWPDIISLGYYFRYPLLPPHIFYFKSELIIYISSSCRLHYRSYIYLFVIMFIFVFLDIFNLHLAYNCTISKCCITTMLTICLFS